MELAELKGAYDCIVSLGSSCEPAAHLRRKGLRTFSSPLDWVVSLSLTDVNRLLSSRFSGYMDLQNMSPIEGNDVFVENEVVMPVKSYFVKDSQSMISLFWKGRSGVRSIPALRTKSRCAASAYWIS